MPLYVYRCAPCDAPCEALQRRLDAPTPPCPRCGRARGVRRAIAAAAFHKDDVTKRNEVHPKYAKAVDAAWQRAAAADPISRTPLGRALDSGRRLQDG